MSSILNALKKLEEDTTAQGRQKTHQHKTIKGFASRKSKNSQKIFRIISLVSVLLLIGTTVWLVINSPQKPSKIETQEQRLEEQSSIQPVHQEKQFPSQDKEEQALVLKSEPEIKLDNQLEEVVKKPIDKPIESSRGKEVIKQPKSAEIRQISKPVVPKSTIIANQPTPKETIIQPQHIQLTLDGLLWSEKPEMRVALINGRYLKEGEIIKGVEILKIEQKTVTLRYGDKEWKLHVKQ